MEKRGKPGPFAAFLTCFGVLVAAGGLGKDREAEDPMKEAVLIVIDVQEKWDNPSWGPRNNPKAEENIAKLLAHWRKTKRPVLFVQHQGLGPIKDAVKPLEGEPVITKRVHSAFIGTDLEDRLRKDARRTLVLTGITTDLCVSSAARTGGNLGYKTYVVGDACATFDRKGPQGRTFKAEDVHDTHLASLAKGFATVVDTQTALASGKAD